jgi:uncharacterized phage protein gp47/JayE
LLLRRQCTLSDGASHGLLDHAYHSRGAPDSVHPFRGIPLPADVASVQAAIDAVKPVTADCIVFALATDAIAVTIHGLVPNTAVTQAAVLASLGALFATTTPGDATIGAGVSPGVPGGTLYLEQVVDAVAQAGGILGFELTAPSASILSASGHVARLGAVTFT